MIPSIYLGGNNVDLCASLKKWTEIFICKNIDKDDDFVTLLQLAEMYNFVHIKMYILALIYNDYQPPQKRNTQESTNLPPASTSSSISEMDVEKQKQPEIFVDDTNHVGQLERIPPPISLLAGFAHCINQEHDLKMSYEFINRLFNDNANLNEEDDIFSKSDDGTPKQEDEHAADANLTTPTSKQDEQREDAGQPMDTNQDDSAENTPQKHFSEEDFTTIRDPTLRDQVLAIVHHNLLVKQTLTKKFTNAQLDNTGEQILKFYFDKSQNRDDEQEESEESSEDD